MNGIWMSKDEVFALPMTGKAWLEVKAAADGSAGPVSLGDQDSDNNVKTMAKALVYVRTGGLAYRNAVTDAVRQISVGTLEKGSRALALGRELAAYVIAADLIDLKTVDSALDFQFRAKLKYLLTFKTISGPGNLILCNEQRPNNWGLHAGASRIAVAMYLDDKTELNKAALIFQGWLGDRSKYAGFTYGDRTWQADQNNPVGVNPLGSKIQGHDVSGSLPDDMRRGGAFAWPPKATGYPWEAMQGAVVQAYLLNRAGYPAFGWSDQAILRAANFLYDIGWPATGDDRWQPWLINKAYGVHFSTTGGGSGKNVGWTSWTHAG